MGGDGGGGSGSGGSFGGGGGGGGGGRAPLLRIFNTTRATMKALLGPCIFTRETPLERRRSLSEHHSCLLPGLWHDAKERTMD
jgi:hypothetical protein